jgi:hypothetical protein
MSTKQRKLQLASGQLRRKAPASGGRAQDVTRTASAHSPPVSVTEEGREGEGGQGKGEGEEGRNEEGRGANNLVSWRHVRSRASH